MINKHIDEVERLEQIVVDDAEGILSQTDLYKLLENPREYLTGLFNAFVTDHLDEIELAKKEGVRFGKSIVANSTGNS